MTSTRSARRCPKPLGLSKGTANRSAMRRLDAVSDTLGGPLWPWQRRVARLGLARRHDRWAFPIMVVVVPRQSGKTRLLWTVCVDRCLAQPGAEVWYTAQTRQDAMYRWKDLGRLLRASPLTEGRSREKSDAWDFRIRSTTGSEEIEFRNGSRLSIFAPAEDSLHGSATDLVVLDEARFFDQAQGDGLLAAVLPTQATRDGQVWIASTAGDPDSGFLRREVEIARDVVDDPTARVGLAEWGLGDAEPEAGQLLDAVWRAHPGAEPAGGRLTFDALAVHADHMPAWQFAHEYGNRWRSDADVRMLPAYAWAQCRHEAALPDGRPTFCADVPLDRSESVIVACVDGVVEVVNALPAPSVAGRLRELIDRWDPPAVVIDAAGPAATVAEQLAGVDRLRIPSTRDLAAACAAFYDDVLAGTAKVRPSPIFDTAAAYARKRPLGQAWAWHRSDGGTALVAASLARQVQARPAVDPSQDWVAF